MGGYILKMVGYFPGMGRKKKEVDSDFESTSLY
jgi:hypothetical protein